MLIAILSFSSGHTVMRRYSGKVYRDAKCRDDLGMQIKIYFIVSQSCFLSSRTSTNHGN